jgi:hypothetical protein
MSLVGLSHCLRLNTNDGVLLFGRTPTRAAKIYYQRKLAEGKQTA